MIELTFQDIQWINELQHNVRLTLDNEIFVKYLTEPMKSDWDETVYCCFESVIFSKTIGFLDLFNKPDSPWQKGFKEFMKTKDKPFIRYTVIDGKWIMLVKIQHNKEYFGDTDEFHVPMESQMLIGYTLEYLESNRSR